MRKSMPGMRGAGLVVIVAGLVLALSAGFVFVGSRRGETSSSIAARPNIVVIMTDDQDYQMMYDVKRRDGSPLMPAVQRLIAATGVTFSRFYVAHSLCCPSRATYLTGQYNHNHGVWGNGTSDQENPKGGYIALDHTNTLPVWLQKAGYFTAHIGKYLNGYGRDEVPPETIPPGWSDWMGLVDPSTYLYYGYTFNENGTLVKYGSDVADYQTDVIRNKAVSFIRRHAEDTSPFFLSITPLAPHIGGPSVVFPVPAPRHAGYFARLRAPRLPNFNEADVSDKPQGFQNAFPLMGPVKVAIADRSYRTRAETLLAVDDLVRAVVAALAESHKLGNTVIIYTSDNGFEHGEHRLPQQKNFVYEESLRVPLLMRGPGVPRGVVNDSLTSNVDLAPTIVQLAGATAERVMDGRSLMPLVQGRTDRWRTALYVEGHLNIYMTPDPPPGSPPIRGMYRGVRTADHFYSEYFETGEKELYNFTADACHDADPYELESQHANPCEESTMDVLRQILEKFEACAGTTCWHDNP